MRQLLPAIIRVPSLVNRSVILLSPFGDAWSTCKRGEVSRCLAGQLVVR